MGNFIEKFIRDANGTWTCIAPATFDGPNGRMQVTPGTCFAPGTRFMGVDLAEWLDKQAGTPAR